MPAPWLIPAILTAAGTLWQNREAGKQARKNREFQERMSSTAEQRRVDDLREARLNPALAYGGGASTPGGGQANVGNAIQDGVSSAQAARALQQQLKIGDETLNLTRNQAHKTAVEGREAATRIELLEQDRDFKKILQPESIRLTRADARLRELMIPGAQNTAQLEEMMGTIKPGISSAAQIARILSEIMKTMRK